MGLFGKAKDALNGNKDKIDSGKVGEDHEKADDQLDHGQDCVEDPHNQAPGNSADDPGGFGYGADGPA